MNTVEILPEQELLSLEEAADFLCVSKSTMYRLLDQSKLRGMKAGKQWRFRKEDLLDYMQRGPAALALGNLPIAVLDTELDALADALVQARTSAEESDDPTLTGEEGKVSQLVRRIVWLLLTVRGSDIHINPVWEPEGAYVLLQLRVDGALREIRRLPFALLNALVFEWKRLAGLPVEERPHPQHGSVRLAFNNRLAALRIATIPTIHGEKVSVRTIPTKVPTMAMLGIDDTPLVDWVKKQRGLILVIGPTGSGKTTTRSAMVQEILSHCTCNIMTVEDPVEYQFPRGVTHIKVEGFSCAEGMRALMQHDPDVIVIGELDGFRGDNKLAQLAFEGTDTGHLVLTCMHASDTMMPLTNFLDWGIKPSMIAYNLIGIALQSLEPKPCPACMAAVSPESALLDTIRRAAEDGGYRLPDDAVFYQPTGCEACRGIGYSGRMALHEFLAFTPEVRSAFLHSASIDEFMKFVRTQGQLSFFAARVKDAVEGKISLDMVKRHLPYHRTNDNLMGW